MRHDFRRYYSVAYDEVPTAEALDLIRSLPMGSLYCAKINPDMAWTLEEYRMTDVIDLLNVINWRMAGHPETMTPTRLERPGDAKRQRDAVVKARLAKEILESTEWEDA